MSKLSKLSSKQLSLYCTWFNALMAVENPPADATAEDRTKLLVALGKAKEAAIAADVPGIRF